MEQYVFTYNTSGEFESYTDQVKSKHLDSKVFTWICLIQPDKETLSQLASRIAMHELTLEDCFSESYIPKFEVFKDSAFLRAYGLKKAPFTKEGSNYTFEDQPEALSSKTAIYMWKNLVLTIHSEKSFWIEDLISEIHTYPNEFLTYTPITLVHEVLDRIIDEITFRLDKLESAVLALETIAIDRNKQFNLNDLLDLKLALYFIKQLATDQSKVIQKISTSLLLQKEDQHYFTDLQDHLQTVSNQIERSLVNLGDVRDAYFATSNVRLGDIMRILAVITTVATPLHLIVGIYGMNFQIMPLLSNHYGFWFLISLMVIIIVSMLLFFKKKGWI